MRKNDPVRSDYFNFRLEAFIVKTLLLFNLPSEELLTDSDLKSKLTEAGISFDAIQIDRSQSNALVYVNNHERLKGILGYADDVVVSTGRLRPVPVLIDEAGADYTFDVQEFMIMPVGIPHKKV